MATRLLVVLLAAALGFATGWWRGSASHQRDQARATLAASEQLRTEEHRDATTTLRRLDGYTSTLQRQRLPALRARADLERVQLALAALDAAPAPPGAAPGCSPDPRLAGLARLLSEGAGLVEEGSRLVDELRAQRDALAAPIAH